jgi:hypothetical protein
MNTTDTRIAFAKALRETLTKKGPKELLHQEFMQRLSELDPDLYYPSRIEDESSNSAWNFCDRYFDALGHGFEDCGGIPIVKATEKLNQIITMFAKGGEVRDPEVLRFYHKPKERRVKKKLL